MSRTAMGSLAMLVLLPALWAEDKPQEKPGKAGTATAAAEYKALMDEYRKAHKEADNVYEKAASAQERNKIRADFRKVECEITDRVLVFAEKHPKDREALLALFFVLHPDIQSEGRNVHKAVQLILKDHIKSDRLTNPPIIQMCASQDSPAVEKLLRVVQEKNPHHGVQAQACLSLAQIIKDRAAAFPPGQNAELTKEAEEWFARVVDKYPDVKEAAERAKGELFEIRNLAVGKTAPDIKGTDSDNKEFKLSDYRGKVVVLDFWAEW